MRAPFEMTWGSPLVSPCGEMAKQFKRGSGWREAKAEGRSTSACVRGLLAAGLVFMA